MRFIADKQTLDDLGITGRYKPDSLFNLFNQTQTAGGERLLEKMFHEPLTDHDAINNRSAIMQYFGQKQLQFPFGKQQMEQVEQYLEGPGKVNQLSSFTYMLHRKLLSLLLHDEQYATINNGIIASIRLLKMIHQLIVQLDDGSGHPWAAQVHRCKSILAHAALKGLIETKEPDQLNLVQVARFDQLLRSKYPHEMKELLQLLYELDVYIAVGGVAEQKKFQYAQALPAGKQVLEIKGLGHPSLRKGVTNHLFFDACNNVCFLTGANMAGKSTWMKSFGIAVYLGHMGFPVAASEMIFSVRGGLYSSINVADNLDQGYSHFYAEVLRVKKVAEDVSRGNNLVVLFDELFKGTNVKDAYDATLAVTKAFARYHNCIFMISTHIIEVGHALQAQCPNVSFNFMPTVMEGAAIRYTYQLQTGITHDRHGMRIIKNERIVDLMRPNSASPGRRN